MDLLTATRRYIDLHVLLPEGEHLLVGVSGGVDSMVLLHVLLELGHTCVVAHVDHGLRGAESDADREFVEQQCDALGVPCMVRRIQVDELAGERGISRAMAARELRYRAFRELLDEHELTTLALAHHADDAVETLFIRLLQGMGLRGWRTIPPISRLDAILEDVDASVDLFERLLDQRLLIRPMLHADRAAIQRYASIKGIPFREDSSNRDTTILRNRIRHELLPLLEQWRPGAGKVMRRNVDLLRELADVAGDALNTEVLNGTERQADGTLVVPVDLILHHAAPRALLQHLLRDLRFHPTRIDDIYRAILEHDRVPASRPPEGVVHMDRDALYISTVQEDPGEWSIPAPDAVPLEAPVLLSTACPQDIDATFSRQVAWFDADALRFPLHMRPWREGDRMRPLGLGGSKLISDMLIDAKVPRHVKDRVYVMESAGRIAWLCGLRLGEGFQAHKDARELVRAEWMWPLP